MADVFSEGSFGENSSANSNCSSGVNGTIMVSQVMIIFLLSLQIVAVAPHGLFLGNGRRDDSSLTPCFRILNFRECSLIKW